MAGGAHDEAVLETATAWFVRMSADTAPDAERRAFRAWLDGDPAHRAAYAQVEALWLELARLPDPRPARAASVRVGPVAGAMPAMRPSYRGSIRRHAVLSACLLLMAAWGLWSLGGYDRLRADHATAVGETRKVTLADGSVAHLNTDTALGVEFAGDRRVVRLYHGEAFFTVAADQHRPFDVATAGGVARAVGTAFNVRSEEAAMTVAVAEGRVQVGRGGEEGTTGGGSIMLGPGESLRYAADGRAVRIAAAVETLTAWRQGKLVFANRPLRAVVAELDRYRPGTIVLLGSRIADERFSGVVSLADTDQALAAIESTLPVDVIRLTGYLTVLSAKN